MPEPESPSPATARPRRLVVGVDGSAASDQALDWAAREAALRGDVLEVVYAMTFRREFLDLYPEAEEGEIRILDDAVARATGAQPTIEVVGRAVDPPAAGALIEASEGAEMLVVGSRGLGGFEGLTLGSVSQQCAHHAHCPLVIVRLPGPGDRRGRGRRATARTAGRRGPRRP